MPRIDHKTGDPILNLYIRIQQLENLIRRTRKPIRVPLTSGTQTSFTLEEGDGSIWIDVDDGSLHWISGGVERKITGTIV
jgi:hypothetical protein